MVDVPFKLGDLYLKILDKLIPLIKCSEIIRTVVIWKGVEIRVVSVNSLSTGSRASPKITYSDD